MMPAYERSAFVVVKAELTLQILVAPLDSPALFERADQLLTRGIRAHRRQHELRGSRLAVRPFDQQPLRRALRAVFAFHEHADPCEPRPQSSVGSFTPSHGTKPGFQAPRDIADRHAFAGRTSRAETADLGCTLDLNSVLHAEVAQRIAENSLVPVVAISEHNATRYAGLYGMLDHVQCKGPLRRVLDVVRNVSTLATLSVGRPYLRNVQAKVASDVRHAVREHEADADLTVRRLASAACVLTLNSRRAFALLEEACVVDDPRVDLRLSLHRSDR